MQMMLMFIISRRMVCGDYTVYAVFVGHAVNEIDELWQQMSRRGVVGRGRNLAP